MARVLFYTGICLLTVSASLLYLPTYFSFIIIAFCLVGLILSIVFRKKFYIAGLTTLLSVTLAFSVLGAAEIALKVEPAGRLEGYRARVVGTVSDWPIRYTDYSVYEIKTESIEIIYKDDQPKLKSVPQDLKLRLSDVNKIDADIFDSIEVEVIFNPLENYKNFSLSNGVYAGGYIEKLIEFNGQDRPFYACFYDLRAYINGLIYDNISFDEATVVSAVLLGDRSLLSYDFYSDSKAAGVTHVLVVSGMHLGILFQLIGGIFNVMRISKRMSAIFLFGAIFALTAVCGFEPSILRSALTYFIMSVGLLIYRKPDPLNSLGAATIIILFTSPFGFGNLSLLLSLLSTFGILYICPLVYDRLCVAASLFGLNYRAVRAVLFALSQTLSATVSTAPISILCFGYISVISPIANLLIGYATTVLMVLSFVTVIILCFSSVIKAAAALPIIAICVIVRYVVWIVGKCAEVPWAVLPTQPIYILPWLFVTIAILMLPLLNLLKDNKFWKSFLRVALSLHIIFAVIAFSTLYRVLPKSKLSVMNVGKGSSIVLNVNENIFVIGAGDTAGDAAVIEGHLLSYGVRGVEYLLLPSLDKSVAGGVPEFIYELSPKAVVCPKSGDYADKLEHIMNDSFSLFNERAAIKADGQTEVYIIANTGVVINADDFSLVVAVGEDISAFDTLITKENKILVCVDNVPNNVEFSIYSAVVLSGSENAVDIMKQALKGSSVTVYDSSKENVILDVGGAVL